LLKPDASAQPVKEVVKAVDNTGSKKSIDPKTAQSPPWGDSAHDAEKIS
jgi:hypothetical protein